jgi:glycosyltransferase involved in cell wall biosynthesis
MVELRRLISGGAFDVVHTHESKAGVLGRVAARGRVPAIVHTIHMASFGDGYSAPASAVFRRLERVCGSFTTFFVAVGRELADSYADAGIGRADRYTIIRSPIRIDSFLAVRDLTSETRQRTRGWFEVEVDSPVIVATGMLEPRKRFDLIIRELAPVLDQASATLIIAGDGPEKERLRSLALELGVPRRVRLLGHVDVIPDLLSIANVYVHASRAEGVSQVIMQSVAAGVPVVATRVEGLHEIDPSPVIEVAADGSGLRSAVSQALAGDHPPPADRGLLQPWTAQQIDADTEAFQRRVARHVERHG